MCKFEDFTASQILREIDFGHNETPQKCHFQKCEIPPQKIVKTAEWFGLTVWKSEKFFFSPNQLGI